MADIVLGIGTSHTPLLTIEGSDWHNRAAADRANPKLTLEDGRYLDYDTLVKERGEPFADEANPENFERIAALCQKHLDHIADEIEAAKLDALIVIGDDQDELYTPGNTPSFALFWGDEIVTHDLTQGEVPDWWRKMAHGYAMDGVHTFPAHSALASAMIDGLMDRDVEVAILRDIEDPLKAGFGHAFGFPAKRLFKGKPLPMVPVMLNTYFKPNVMRPSRAFDVGRHIRDIVNGWPQDMRVGVLASGGLSHFVVLDELDETVMAGLSDPEGTALRSLPRQALVEGTSEILNWVMTAGAASGLELDWSEYIPIRRTPAGTGIGCAFAIWKGQRRDA